MQYVKEQSQFQHRLCTIRVERITVLWAICSKLRTIVDNLRAILNLWIIKSDL